MKNLNIEKLEKENCIDYNDGDIFIIDSISKIKDYLSTGNNFNFQEIDSDIIVLVVCVQGMADIVLSNKKCHLQYGDILVCSPNSFVENYNISSDFDCKIIGFSVKTIDSSLYFSKNVWRNIYYVSQHPIVHLKESDMKLFSYYYYIAECKVKDKPNLYHKEIMHSLLSCLTYEFLMVINRYFSQEDIQSYGVLKQGDVLFRKFIELLVKEQGRIRSVAQAADNLNVSSKYLSSVIKNASGKKALEIIHHYTLQEIIHRLKYTDKTIQEISYDMNFPSLSFFGKFFKIHMGISPKQFRKKESNWEQV